MNKLFLIKLLYTTLLIGCIENTANKKDLTASAPVSNTVKHLYDNPTLTSTTNNGSKHFFKIPDPVLRKYLKENYPDYFIDNEFIDTTYCLNSEKSVAVLISNTELKSLEGIQYFKNLEYIICENNKISFVPKLPSEVIKIRLSGNQLSTLPTLPEKLMELEVSNNHLTKLPKLPQNLNTIYCADNLLKEIPLLPEKMMTFSAYGNCFKTIPSKPIGYKGSFDVSPNSDKCK